ncbi:7281_t:CDS:2, partial [Racocetra persica]
KELGLDKCLKTENLDDYMTLCHDLEQYDPEKRQERPKKDLEFREQEELGMVVKTRAIAVHRAKVPKSHPDNGSDIRKMLESQRKRFRKILEKKFDKRGQFKFALCSLTKFLIDDKPKNEKQGKKNSQTDWLRNTQIIVYNRNEIVDYLSSAFKQILYQVEERG